MNEQEEYVAGMRMATATMIAEQDGVPATPIDWCERCAKFVEITDSGHNAGFAGEGFSWINYSCGHSDAEHGPINENTI